MDTNGSTNSSVNGLEAIRITHRLVQRPSRAPNLKAENRVYDVLARDVSRRSRTLPQQLVDSVLGLCPVGSAGLSMLRPGGDYLYWRALAGALARRVDTEIVTARAFSPCGVALEHGTAQLFRTPDTYFTYLSGLGLPIHELLVVPLTAGGCQLGTIWAAQHSPTYRFDVEDLRLLMDLGDFASIALQALAEAERAALPEVVRRPVTRALWWRRNPAMDHGQRIGQ